MSAILANDATVPVSKVKSDSITVTTAGIMVIEFQTLAAQGKTIYCGIEALLVTPSLRDKNTSPVSPFVWVSESVMLYGNRTCFLFSLLYLLFQTVNSLPPTPI